MNIWVCQEFRIENQSIFVLNINIIQSYMLIFPCWITVFVCACVRVQFTHKFEAVISVRRKIVSNQIFPFRKLSSLVSRD